MRDSTITALAIGGSEVAALVGLDPNRDAFSVYAEKLGLVEPAPPTPRMRMGKKLERIIAEVYAEETGQCIAWCDRTMQHVDRSWQVFTIDAFVLATESPTGGQIVSNMLRYPTPPLTLNLGLAEYNALGLLDAKNVSWDQSPLWGEAGTDQVPDRIACQIQYYLDATGLPWGDVAALFGGNDLRIYRVNYDANIADVLRGAAEEFVKNHLEPQIPPPIGHSDTAARYLKQRWPKNVQNIRQATPDEVMLMSRYKQERAVYNEALARKTDLEHQVKEIIADCDGIDDPVLGRVTYKYVKSQVGADWKAVAEAILADWSNGIFTEPPDLTEYAELHQRVLREGFRRIAVPRNWKTTGEEE